MNITELNKEDIDIIIDLIEPHPAIYTDDGNPDYNQYPDIMAIYNKLLKIQKELLS